MVFLMIFHGLRKLWEFWFSSWCPLKGNQAVCKINDCSVKKLAFTSAPFSHLPHSTCEDFSQISNLSFPLKFFTLSCLFLFELLALCIHVIKRAFNLALYTWENLDIFGCILRCESRHCIILSVGWLIPSKSVSRCGPETNPNIQ